MWRFVEIGDYDQLNRVLNVSLHSIVSATMAASKPLQLHNGCVVYLGSDEVFHGYYKAHSIYMAESGLRMLCESMAIELGNLVRVNSVDPGPIDTATIYSSAKKDDIALFYRNCTLLRRFGRVDEIANAVMFVITNATFCQGAHLLVDGGMTYNSPSLTSDNLIQSSLTNIGT